MKCYWKRKRHLTIDKLIYKDYRYLQTLSNMETILTLKLVTEWNFESGMIFTNKLARQFCCKIISYWTTWTFQNKDNSESNSYVNKLQNIGNVCAKATLQACCKFRIPFIYLFAWGSHFSNHKQYSFCLESTKRSLTQIHHQEEEQSRFYLLILIAHIYKTKAVFLISANENLNRRL